MRFRHLATYLWILKFSIEPARWLNGLKHLPPSLKTWVWAPKPVWWKGRTNYQKMNFDLRMHAAACTQKEEGGAVRERRRREGKEKKKKERLECVFSYSTAHQVLNRKLGHHTVQNQKQNSYYSFPQDKFQGHIRKGRLELKCKLWFVWDVRHHPLGL